MGRTQVVPTPRARLHPVPPGGCLGTRLAVGCERRGGIGRLLLAASSILQLPVLYYRNVCKQPRAHLTGPCALTGLHRRHQATGASLASTPGASDHHGLKVHAVRLGILAAGARASPAPALHLVAYMQKLWHLPCRSRKKPVHQQPTSTHVGVLPCRSRSACIYIEKHLPLTQPRLSRH